MAFTDGKWPCSIVFYYILSQDTIKFVLNLSQLSQGCHRISIARENLRSPYVLPHCHLLKYNTQKSGSQEIRSRYSRKYIFIPGFVNFSDGVYQDPADSVDHSVDLPKVCLRSDKLKASSVARPSQQILTMVVRNCYPSSTLFQRCRNSTKLSRSAKPNSSERCKRRSNMSTKILKPLRQSRNESVPCKPTMRKQRLRMYRLFGGLLNQSITQDCIYTVLPRLCQRTLSHAIVSAPSIGIYLYLKRRAPVVIISWKHVCWLSG